MRLIHIPNKLKRGRVAFILLIILILALVLRTYKLNDPGLTFDELSTLAWTSSNMYEDKFVNEPYKAAELVSTIIKHAAGTGSYPPVYYLFVASWVNLGGNTSEIFLRLLTVLLSLVAIVYTYLLGKLLFNEKVGLLAAFFFSIIPYSIFWARQAVNYHITATFFLMSIFYSIKLLKYNKIGSIILYAISSCLLIFVNNYGILVFFIQNVTIFGFWILKRFSIKKWLIAQGVMLIVFLLYGKTFLRFTLKRQLTSNSPLSWISFSNNLVSQFSKIIGELFGGKFYNNLILFSLIIFLIAGISLLLKKEYLKFILLGSWTFIPFFVTAMFPNVFREKCFIFIVPALVIIFSFILISFWDNSKPILKIFPLIIICIFCCVSIASFNIYTNSDLNQEGLREISRYLELNSDRELIIMSHSYPAPVIQYYYPGGNVIPLYWKEGEKTKNILLNITQCWYLKIHESWIGYNEELEEILDSKFQTKAILPQFSNWGNELIYYTNPN